MMVDISVMVTVGMMVSGGWQCDGGSVLLSSVAVPACEAVESQPWED